MNKYVIIGIIAVVLVGVGLAFSKIKPQSDRVVQGTGNEVKFTVRAVKNEWRWDTELIKVNAGDKVILTLINEDDYDHGVGLDAYGINERMPANGTITIEFTATRKGKFSFYCSVPCGKGEVAGKTRDHFDMLGELEVV
ncbi:MAG TPA: cupredoxin domain-containing protein [Verrucomicrobiae bacterium]|nr:cupredoxin domain-containing protein [Verrucomicrobiae bacterium]